MTSGNPSTDGVSRVWVLTWMYHDRSGSGFIRAFDSEEKARALLNILLTHTGTDRAYCIDPVEIEREYP